MRKNIKMFSTRSIMPHENPYLQGVLSLVSLLAGGGVINAFLQREKYIFKRIKVFATVKNNEGQTLIQIVMSGFAGSS